MASRKSEIKKLKKRVKHMRKIVKIGLRTLRERDAKIAQLTSVLTMQNKPVVADLAHKRKHAD